MTASTHPATSPGAALAGVVRRQSGRLGPLGVILALHAALFLALQHGLSRQAPPPAQPREIVATFVTPERPPELPKPLPQPVAPKTVPVVKKAATPPRPAPVVTPAPAPTAITAPPPEPAAPAPAPAVAQAAPAVPAPAAPPATGPRTVTSGIEYLQPPQPEYPPISKRLGEEGRAVVRVLVNEKGRPERAEVQKSTGIARLDEAARQAVLRAVFKPFMEDGKAVPAYALVPIRFQLDN